MTVWEEDAVGREVIVLYLKRPIELKWIVSHEQVLSNKADGFDEKRLNERSNTFMVPGMDVERTQYLDC